MLIILAKIAVKKSPKKLISAKKNKRICPYKLPSKKFELYANIHDNPGSKMILKHFDIHKAVSSFRTTFQFIWAFQHL